MHKLLIAASLCGLMVAATPVSNPVSTPVSTPTQSSSDREIRGDYVEARTASVFAGACHYNSEYMTTGRDAVMAWNITSGKWNGTSLAGVRVMAIVASESNLAETDAAHKAQIIVDSPASSAQASAVVAAIEAQSGVSLGKVVAVRRAAVSFSHVDRSYTASAAGFANLTVQGMPNDECCSQPGLVWYSPLIPLTGAKVGFTQTAACASDAVGDCWSRADENGAFYGAFSFSAAPANTVASAF